MSWLTIISGFQNAFLEVSLKILVVRGFHRGFFWCVFSLLFFSPPWFYDFSLGKIRRKWEGIVSSLQGVLNMLAAAKVLQITLWAWDTDIRKQGVAEEVKRFSRGGRLNCTVFAFVLDLWVEQNEGWNWKSASSKQIGEIDVWNPFLFFGISGCSCVCIIVKS